LIDIVKIANGELLEQHKFKSNEKDTFLSFFRYFMGLFADEMLEIE